MKRTSLHMRAIPLLAVALGFLLGPVGWAQQPPRSESGANPCLVVILEGLRPEFVTDSLMPNLSALSKDGVRVTRHHAVFPAVAPVNAASIATGAYPSAHGVLGDVLGTVEVGSVAVLKASDSADPSKFDAATGGGLLAAPALGEVFAAQGISFLAIGSGSSESALLLNATAAGIGLVHPESTRPESLAAKVRDRVGPAPGDRRSAARRNAWAVDAYLTVALSREVTPDVTVLWLAEPASTQREAGLGAGANLDAIRAVDAELGRIRDRHRELGLRVNVFVTSAGGFSTATGPAMNLTKLLVEAGLKADANSTDVVVAGERSMYVENRDKDKIRRIVARLQREDWVGAIYTQQVRPTHPEGIAPGALSFQAVYLDHERAPDILVEPAWSDEKNAYGQQGTKRRIGGGANPTSSPYELHVPFIASGPDLKRGIESGVPAAHPDVAPTLCHLIGVDAPATMTGRVLHEILRGGPEPQTVEVARRRHGSHARWEGGRYLLMMTEYSVDGVDYFSSTELRR